VPFWTFLALDACAAAVGVPASFGLAFLFADQVEQVLADVHRAERWLGLFALVVIAAWISIALWRRGRRA
jgi:membrane protein DedA with SNARE-associated domain